MEKLPEAVELPVVWVGRENVETVVANQFVIQIDPDTELYYLIAGHLAHPIIAGTAEEQLEAVKQISRLEVQTRAAFALTKTRILELRDVLNRVAEGIESEAD